MGVLWARTPGFSFWHQPSGCSSAFPILPAGVLCRQQGVLPVTPCLELHFHLLGPAWSGPSAQPVSGAGSEPPLLGCWHIPQGQVVCSLRLPGPAHNLPHSSTSRTLLSLLSPGTGRP